MRSILAAAALLLAAGGLIGTGTAEARDYPWCSRAANSDFNPSCGFTSYAQCMATVSGLGGDCIRNPFLAPGTEEQQRRRGRPHHRRHD